MNPSRLLEIFLQVIRINALSSNEKPIADFVHSFLNQLNYNVELDDSFKYTKSNTGNVICKIGSGGDFVMTAHMDTARPTENVNPIVKEDRITSSGDTVLGVDNRVGVAVLLYTLEKIYLEKVPVKDFTVAFTTCEETTLLGSKYLALNGKIKKGFVFDSGYRPGKFIYSSCGAIAFNIKVIGKASHSGIEPEKGINSLTIASKAISKLQLGRVDTETTINIGKLSSGSAVNVVPEITEMSGEIRSFNLDKAENYMNSIIKTFRDEAKEMNAIVEYDYYWDFKPYRIEENAEVYIDIINTLTKVGLNPQPKISFGGSDANSFNANGIKSVNIGIGAQNPHSNDEFIYIEDLIKSSEIALELVKMD
jgi:tripeptide aminopeptidase